MPNVPISSGRVVNGVSPGNIAFGAVPLPLKIRAMSFASTVMAGRSWQWCGSVNGFISYAWDNLNAQLLVGHASGLIGLRRPVHTNAPSSSRSRKPRFWPNALVNRSAPTVGRTFRNAV